MLRKSVKLQLVSFILLLSIFPLVVFVAVMLKEFTQSMTIASQELIHEQHKRIDTQMSRTLKQRLAITQSFISSTLTNDNNISALFQVDLIANFAFVARKIINNEASAKSPSTSTANPNLNFWKSHYYAQMYQSYEALFQNYLTQMRLDNIYFVDPDGLVFLAAKEVEELGCELKRNDCTSPRSLSLEHIWQRLETQTTANQKTTIQRFINEANATSTTSSVKFIVARPIYQYTTKIANVIFVYNESEFEDIIKANTITSVQVNTALFNNSGQISNLSLNLNPYQQTQIATSLELQPSITKMHRVYSDEQGEMHNFYTKISLLNEPWYLVTQVPTSFYLHRIRNSILVGAIVTLSLIFLIVTLAWQFSEAFVRPIRKLARIATKMTQSAPHKQNEIEHIEHSIYSLHDQLTDAAYSSQKNAFFLAAASHDLKQPLQAMGLLIASLEKQNDPTMSRTIKGLKQAHHSLLEMFIATLDIVRLEASPSEVNITCVGLNTIFDMLRSEFEVITADKNLTISIVPTKLKVQTDAILLTRILRNLISNAVHYTPKGKILVGARRLGSEVSICVFDTGIGIAPQQAESIFAAFNQIDPQSDGVGLGLAIVERYARLLCHQVEMQSSVGKGTCFQVKLAKCGDNPQIITKTHLLANQQSIHIYDFDENQTDSNELAAQFQKWGCEVQVFNLAHIPKADNAISIILWPSTLPTSSDDSTSICQALVAQKHLALNVLDALASLSATHIKPTQEHIQTVWIVGNANELGLEQIAKKYQSHILYRPVSPAHLRTILLSHSPAM